MFKACRHCCSAWRCSSSSSMQEARCTRSRGCQAALGHGTGAGAGAAAAPIACRAQTTPEAMGVKVHAAIGLVGHAIADNALHIGDDLRDEFAHAGQHVGLAHAQGVHVLEEFALQRGNAGARAAAEKGQWQRVWRCGAKTPPSPPSPPLPKPASPLCTPWHAARVSAVLCTSLTHWGTATARALEGGGGGSALAGCAHLILGSVCPVDAPVLHLRPLLGVQCLRNLVGRDADHGVNRRLRPACSRGDAAHIDGWQR
jgi:hypothetical protein